MTEKEREILRNAIPQKPIKHELGGGYYYTCHWMKCGEELKRWYRYCPWCSQRIDWEGEEE